MSLPASAITLTPLAIGGAGIVEVLLPAMVQAITAFVGPDAAIAYNDPNPALVQVPLPLPTFAAPPWGDEPTGGTTQAGFFGAPMTAGLVLTVFTKTSGVWDTGVSLSGFNLQAAFSWEFPWDADWVVARIQDVATTIQPLPSKVVRVTRAFPRDTHAWPAINVQVDGLNPCSTFIGNMMQGVMGGNFQTSLTKGKLWTLQLSIVAWCATPEERSALGAWLGGAMEVVLDAARAIGWADPVATYKESEDFETLEIPAFLVTANLTVTVQSSLQVAERNDYPNQTL
jgi:hypothetical protein